MEMICTNTWKTEDGYRRAKMGVELYEEDGFFVVEVVTFYEKERKHSFFGRVFTSESEARSYFDYLEIKVNKFFNSLVRE